MNDLDVLFCPVEDLAQAISVSPWKPNYRLRKLIRKALCRKDFREHVSRLYVYEADDQFALTVGAEAAGFEVRYSWKHKHPMFIRKEVT